MIIREIKNNPEEIIKNFDFFNDYKDTRRWMESVCPELLPKLDVAYNKWHKKLTTYEIYKELINDIHINIDDQDEANNITNKLEKLVNRFDAEVTKNEHTEGSLTSGTVVEIFENRLKMMNEVLDNANFTRDIKSQKVNIDLNTRMKILSLLKNSMNDILQSTASW